jgi:hypothetical protein
MSMLADLIGLATAAARWRAPNENEAGIAAGLTIACAIFRMVVSA